jgi:ABC-2 type transport system ATP-binding protein
MQPQPLSVRASRPRSDLTPPQVQQKNVKLKVLAPSDAVITVLTGMPNVFKITPAPGGIVLISYAGDDQALATIVRAIVMAGVPVVGVEPERNELERIFLEVTKGEVQ